MTRAEELRVLRKALRIADSCGMRSEFRWSYLNYRRMGDTVSRACGCALYDWDM